MTTESTDGLKWLAFLADEDYAKAIECLDAEIAADPSDFLYSNKAVVLAKAGDPAGVIECFEKALQIDPDTGAARKGMEMITRLYCMLKDVKIPKAWRFCGSR